jgi:DNA polymerase (family X)
LRSMDKNRIAEILEEMGILLELKGDNPFKTRAYHKASAVISSTSDDITQLAEKSELTKLNGIGPGIADIITELVKTGTSRHYSSLKASFPVGILELLRVQGIGPKRIKLLYDKLDIKTVEELSKACRDHKLRSLDGFGKRIEENILKSISYRKSSSRFLYPQALQYAEEIVKRLKNIKGTGKCSYAGSLLRRRELIGDIDILASAADKKREAIISAFTSLDIVESIIATGDTKASVMLKNGMQCDLRVVSHSEYPFALNYFTGSKEHNVGMRRLARKKGLSLNEYGFSKIGKKGGVRTRKPDLKEEKDIYKFLGLCYIPPELREGTGELEYAQKKQIPDLVNYSDIRGTFHCHTTDSDGYDSLEQFVLTARNLGWSYLGISDHSQAAAHAGGLPVDKMRRQIQLIDRMNEKEDGFHIFKGTECEIFTDGSIDYNGGFLAEFDYVVASIHNNFNMTEKEATLRIVKALKNKYVTILGHPTGRLLAQREGYPVNIKTVIDAASDYGKAIEINSHPTRLDLDWRFVRYAKEKRVPIFINPDAHRAVELNFVRYGTGIARKGWLEARDVVNTRNLAQVTKFLNQMKRNK